MEKINTQRLVIGDEVSLKDRYDDFHKLVVVGIIGEMFHFRDIGKLKFYAVKEKYVKEGLLIETKK